MVLPPTVAGIATAVVVADPGLSLAIELSPGATVPGGVTIANSGTPEVTIKIRPVC